MHIHVCTTPFAARIKGASGADAPPTTHVFSDDEYPSEILDDFLFLGAYGAAKTRHVLDDLGIVRVVNASETCAMYATTTTTAAPTLLLF